MDVSTDIICGVGSVFALPVREKVLSVRSSFGLFSRYPTQYTSKPMAEDIVNTHAILCTNMYIAVGNRATLMHHVSYHLLFPPSPYTNLDPTSFT